MHYVIDRSLAVIGSVSLFVLVVCSVPYPDGRGVDPDVLLPVRLREAEVRWLLAAGRGEWRRGVAFASLLDGVRRRGAEAALFGARD